MASIPTGVTVSLPSGAISEVESIAVRTGGRSIGFNRDYNPDAATVTIVSFDAPGSTVGSRGNFSISGTGYSYSATRGYVDSVDSSITVGGVVKYTTAIKLITIGGVP